MINRKGIRLFKYAVIISIVVFLVVKIIDAIKSANKAFEEQLESTYVLPSDHASLFSKKYLDKIQVNEVYNSKVRNPISYLTYDFDYDIFVYRVDSNVESGLNGLLNLNLNEKNRTTGISYNIKKGNHIVEFEYKAGKVEPVNKINLFVNGGLLQTVVKSDSLVNYFMDFRTLAIQYGSGPVDIFLKGDENWLTIKKNPVSILFLRRDKSVYLMIMITKIEEPLDPSLLYKIVKGD